MVWWILLLIVTVILFVVIHAVILPKLFLKFDLFTASLPDRGRAVIDEVNGKSIIYEPDVKIRKYIKQYILSERKGEKYFICKIDEAISYIDYDLVLFNDEGKSFKVVNLNEVIEKRGYTHTVSVPDETAYVTIVLNAVDNSRFKNNTVNRIRVKRVLAYLALSIIADLLAVICVKACLAYIFGGVFGESFLVLDKSWGITGAVAAALVVLNAAFVLLIICLANRKKKPEGEKCQR